MAEHELQDMFRFSIKRKFSINGHNRILVSSSSIFWPLNWSSLRRKQATGTINPKSTACDVFLLTSKIFPYTNTMMTACGIKR